MTSLKAKVLIAIAFCWLVTLGISLANAQDSQKIELDLNCVDGTRLSVPQSEKFTVLCFLGTECPLVKLYTPRLFDLEQEFSKQFTFVGINSNLQDSVEEWSDFAKASQIAFAIVSDKDNVIADRLDVVRNPEVIVVGRKGEIKYRGRIDDQYAPGISRSRPNRQDLRIAMTELLDGKNVSVPRTEPEGCLIGKVKTRPVDPSKATVTYARDIAPLFQKHCLECHRQGDIGPFSMTDYEEVVGWADMILETIDDGRMPPWHADPKFGKFRNAREVSNVEKQTIRKWIAEGAHLGDAEDLPEPKTFTTGWRLPKEPDLVIPMRSRPFEIPAEGTVEYQYFIVDPQFKEDKWVVAAEVIPGNRAIVHHSIVFIRPPDGELTFGLNWLEAYVPGQVPLKHEPKRARRIPAGSKLVFQQHYTPNGKVQSDITKVGLVFIDESEVEEELFTLAALNQEFEILPNQADAKVVAQLPWLPANGKILSVSPHMHYRGKSFTAFAAPKSQTKSDARPETLLRVPNYDFNWQHIYEFEQPLDLSNLKEVKVEITFDNSADNPFNPNPEQYVIWGDQTWEEMAIGFFNVTRPKIPTNEVEVLSESDETASISETSRISEADLKKGTEVAKSLFARNAANGDRRLVTEEMPRVTHWYFYELDTDGDGLATFEEVEATAQMRYHAKRK